MATDKKEQQAEPKTKNSNGADSEQVLETEVEVLEADSAKVEQTAEPQPDFYAVLERLKQELEESRDLYLKAKAELENQRKRSARELQNAHKYAIDRFATDLLDVMESLDQACQIERSETSSEEIEAVRNGIELTQKQLVSVFQRFSIVEICPEPGEKFDPNSHQAMTMQQTGDVAPNHVVTTIRKGYWIHDRLLRPAMVIVAQELAEKSKAVDGDDESELEQ